MQKIKQPNQKVNQPPDQSLSRSGLQPDMKEMEIWTRNLSR